MRWASHVQAFKKGSKSPLSKDISILGIDKFSYCELERFKSTEVRYANRREGFWIKKLNSIRPYGYNSNNNRLEIDESKEFVNKIKDHIDKLGIKLTYLTGSLEFPKSYFYMVNSGRRIVTEERRKKINEALGTDY